jgi:hypothetical protein
LSSCSRCMGVVPKIGHEKDRFPLAFDWDQSSAAVPYRTLQRFQKATVCV